MSLRELRACFLVDHMKFSDRPDLPELWEKYVLQMVKLGCVSIDLVGTPYLERENHENI